MSKYIVEVQHEGEYRVIELKAGSRKKAINKAKRALGTALNVLGVSRLDREGVPVTPSNLAEKDKVKASNLVRIDEAKPRVKYKPKPSKPVFKYQHKVTDEFLVLMGHPSEEVSTDE